MIIEQIVLQEDPDTSRTQLSIFAALFTTLVLFQVMGIDPFSWKSLKKSWQSSCILGLIGAVAILLPSEVIPTLFQFTPLENIDLLVLAFGVAGCVVLLRFILEKIHFFDVLHKILYQ